MKKAGFLWLFMLLGLAGCGGLNFLSPAASVCDGLPPGDSLICDTAAANGTTPEAGGNMLILVNAVAIGEGVYTLDQALGVLTGIQEELGSPLVSYLAVNFLAREATRKYPGLFEIISLYAGLDTPEMMLEADRRMLLAWVGERIVGLESAR